MALSTFAQTRREQVRAKVDSVLTARRNKTSYDTNYVVRPEGRLTLKVRGNVSGTTFHARGNVNSTETRADLSADRRATLSFGVNYMGLTAGLAINPASLTGRNKDYEMNLNAYSSRFNIDATYQTSKTLEGDMRLGNTTTTLNKGVLDYRMLTATGYYTFNHRRFSLPAAFTQSYIQKRSAGSWMVGFSFQGGRTKNTDEKSSETPDVRIYAGHFGIGGGYGYNWVLPHDWLVHLSAMPTFILFNNNNITINDEKRDMKTRFPDMIFNEHVAVVHTFSPRYFAGVTLVMSNSLYGDRDNLRINNNHWRMRTFLGIRL